MTIVHGSHDQYLIFDDHGSITIDDTHNGRDGSQGAPGNHEVVFTDGIGVLDDTGAAEHVARLYVASLGRSPDVAGLEFWAGQVNDSHVSLADLAQIFSASPEFIHNFGGMSDSAYVSHLYNDVLHRPEDIQGTLHWEHELSSGVSRGAVAQIFADSPEFRSDSRSVAGDRDDAESYRLYQTALNRAPDDAGHQFWSAKLSGGATPAQVAQAFIDSPEFQREFAGLGARDFVSKLYQNAFGRPADQDGLEHWASALQQGTSQASLVVTFADSHESRAGTANATHDGWVFVHA